MHKNGISVIVVSWNTKNITSECLRRLEIAKGYLKDESNCEIIVVDNNSTDGTSTMIAKKYPWVKLIKSKFNLGYSAGNNLGFRNSDSKNSYLLLLNSDAYVEEDTLSKSLDYFEKNINCDVLGCQLKFENGKIQPSAGNLPTPTNVLSWIWGFKFFNQFHPRSANYFKYDKKVGWVQGAYLFMKRKVFEETHGFDENFFMYMDEVEWSRRVGELKYNIFYTPSFSITHLDRASAHKVPEKLAKTFSLEIIGVVYYLRKYYPRSLSFLLPLIKLAVFLRLLAFTILENKVRTLAYAKVLREI